jgi:hypothetical protein
MPKSDRTYVADPADPAEMSSLPDESVAPSDAGADARQAAPVAAIEENPKATTDAPTSAHVMWDFMDPPY